MMASSEGRRGRAPTHALRASIVIVALAALTLVGLTACSSPSQSGSQPPISPAAITTNHSNPPAAVPVALDPSKAKPAVQKQFAPFDENGRLVVPASDGGAGSCFTTSIAVPVAGVFRCLAGNTILDPCFASVHESSPATVTCFADPWSEGATVHLAASLPEYAPVLTAGDPWGIELTNGVRCVSITGTVPSFGAVNLTYRCDVSMVAGITVGDNGAIVAHYGPLEGPLTDVAVATAWRGRSYRIS